MRRVVLVGNPGGRRAELFAAALARRGWPPAAVVPWIDVIAGRGRLDELAAGGAWVRLDSPGRDWEVERALIARGAAEGEDEDTGAEAISADEARTLPFEKGRILLPRQWYRGFRAVLRGLAARPGVNWLTDPAEVIDLFDKRRCQARIGAAGVPIPAGVGSPRSFDELMDVLQAAGRWRVFVKLACGSSGSGVAAFAVGRGRMQATTTVELVRRDGRCLLFNSRRVRRYETAAEVAALFDALCREGVRVEEWVPKAGLGGRAFDVRVLVVAGRVRQVVGRLSATPLTNLHLLNERADAATVRAAVPADRWAEALADCERAAAAFPGCHHLGVDLAFTPGFRRRVVFEANAFGDLLPGVSCDGLDSYETQLAALGDSPP
ncbi:MAG: STM4014 family protein [Gemmataceae bacterium]|nr:STM4014 family protein [Gemmataceae bacterium]